MKYETVSYLGGLRAALDYLSKQKREAAAAIKDAELLALTPSSDVDLHHLQLQSSTP